MDPISTLELSVLFIAIALIVVKAVLFHKNFPGMPFSQWLHLDGTNGYNASNDGKTTHASKLQNMLTFVIFMLLFVVWIMWLLTRS